LKVIGVGFNLVAPWDSKLGFPNFSQIQNLAYLGTKNNAYFGSLFIKKPKLGCTIFRERIFSREFLHNFKFSGGPRSFQLWGNLGGALILKSLRCFYPNGFKTGYIGFWSTHMVFGIASQIIVWGHTWLERGFPQLGVLHPRKWGAFSPKGPNIVIYGGYWSF